MSIYRSSIGSVIQAMNTGIGGTPADDSVHDYLTRIIGEVAYKQIDINASEASANVNCFQITGSVEIKRIYGVINSVTTLTNCTGVYFDLYDSTAAVAITKNDGVLSGLGAGTFFLRDTTAATTMTVITNAVGAVTDPPTNKPFYPFIVTQKSGANTYIRFNYTTTDAPANAVFTIYVEYREPPNSGGTLTAV